MIPDEIQITAKLENKEQISYVDMWIENLKSANQVFDNVNDEIYDDSLILLGAVKGSNRSIYSQSIEITDEFENDDIVIEGQCSCPVGYNCKHVVAVCIYYIMNMRYSTTAKIDYINEKSQVDMWLENLETTNLDKTNSEYFIT